MSATSATHRRPNYVSADEYRNRHKRHQLLSGDHNTSAQTSRSASVVSVKPVSPTVGGVQTQPLERVLSHVGLAAERGDSNNNVGQKPIVAATPSVTTNQTYQQRHLDAFSASPDPVGPKASLIKAKNKRTITNSSASANTSRNGAMKGTSATTTTAGVATTPRNQQLTAAALATLGSQSSRIATASKQQTPNGPAVGLNVDGQTQSIASVVSVATPTPSLYRNSFIEQRRQREGRSTPLQSRIQEHQANIDAVTPTKQLSINKPHRATLVGTPKDDKKKTVLIRQQQLQTLMKAGNADKSALHATAIGGSDDIAAHLTSSLSLLPSSTLDSLSPSRTRFFSSSADENAAAQLRELQQDWNCSRLELSEREHQNRLTLKKRLRDDMDAFKAAENAAKERAAREDVLRKEWTAQHLQVQRTALLGRETASRIDIATNEEDTRENICRHLHQQSLLQARCSEERRGMEEKALSTLGDFIAAAVLHAPTAPTMVNTKPEEECSEPEPTCAPVPEPTPSTTVVVEKQLHNEEEERPQSVAVTLQPESEKSAVVGEAPSTTPTRTTHHTNSATDESVDKSTEGHSPLGLDALDISGISAATPEPQTKNTTEMATTEKNNTSSPISTVSMIAALHNPLGLPPELLQFQQWQRKQKGAGEYSNSCSNSPTKKNTAVDALGSSCSPVDPSTLKLPTGPRTTRRGVSKSQHQSRTVLHGGLDPLQEVLDDFGQWISEPTSGKENMMPPPTSSSSASASAIASPFLISPTKQPRNNNGCMAGCSSSPAPQQQLTASLLSNWELFSGDVESYALRSDMEHDAVEMLAMAATVACMTEVCEEHLERLLLGDEAAA